MGKKRPNAVLVCFAWFRAYILSILLFFDDGFVRYTNNKNMCDGANDLGIDTIIKVRFHGVS